jgi:hypothetical protein
MHTPLRVNPRCVLRARIADLIAAWGQCVTNRRRASHDVQIEDAWQEHVLPIWLTHGAIVAGSILNEARIWQWHCTCISNIQ